MHVIAAALGLLLATQQPAVVTSVRIDAHWGGLGTPRDERWTVTRAGDHYRSGRRTIAAEAVERLVRAVESAPVPQETALRELASGPWLLANAKRSYTMLTQPEKPCSPEAEKLFVDAFTNPETAVAAFRSHYRSFHTDDYPSMKVRIRFTDGRELAVSAASLEGHVSIVQAYHAWPGQFAAHLRLPDAPSNLLVDAHMNLHGNAPEAAETFSRRVPIFVERVRPFVAAHPDITFELWYRDGVSMDKESLQLHEITERDDPNTARVKAALRDSVLLRDHADFNTHRQWVVLPTGEGVEWEQ